MVYVKLCSVNDVSAGDLKQLIVKGTEILVINKDNQFVCLDARCTHAGAPLAEGELSGDTLTCPWHGSKFNISSGIVLKGPARQPLRIYQSMTKENYVYVEL